MPHKLEDRLYLRIKPEFKNRLQNIADHYNISLSDLVRECLEYEVIRRERDIIRETSKVK